MTKITNRITRRFRDIEVRLEISDTEEKFQYRLVAKEIDAKVGKVGKWRSNCNVPTILHYKGRIFVAFTESWEGAFPIEQPLEITQGQ